MKESKWVKLQISCLICKEDGPYYLVTKEEDKTTPPQLKKDEHLREALIWMGKHHHDGKTSVSTKYLED